VFGPVENLKETVLEEGITKQYTQYIFNLNSTQHFLAILNPIKRGRGLHMTLTLSKLIFSTIYIMTKN